MIVKQQMKGKTKMKTYTIEEIREAVNLVIGDNGSRSDEVIDVLETDVEQNTKDYLNNKMKG